MKTEDRLPLSRGKRGYMTPGHKTHGRGNKPFGGLPFYAAYLLRFFVTRRQEPLIYGIALTDRCNLSCEGCRVSNTGRRDMTLDEITAGMEDAWERGFRELYFTGGEPMLWRCGEVTPRDLILKARTIGFHHVHLYTNGLSGIESAADMVWVSMDGLPGVFDARRGSHFQEVEAAVRSSSLSRIAVIFVVDRRTEKGIEQFLRWVRDTSFPVRGVMFYFHTPYYGKDDLFLDSRERASVIDRLLSCIGEGLPVLNSRAGLRAMKSGRWPRPFAAASVLDVDGESLCCRFNDGVCAECGYAACAELTQAISLRPTALSAMMRYL